MKTKPHYRMINGQWAKIVGGKVTCVYKEIVYHCAHEYALKKNAYFIARWTQGRKKPVN